MNKPYYPCEHCIYFYQHYGISDEMIHKLSCGRCDIKKQIVKMTQRRCKYFKELTNEVVMEKKERRAMYVLTSIEKNLANLKLYFNNDKASQKIDKCLIDRLKS